MAHAGVSQALLERIAAALADDQPGRVLGVAALPALLELVATMDAMEIEAVAPDLVACWQLRGLELPPAIAPVAALVLPPDVAPAEVEGWEALGAWYAARASSARSSVRLSDEHALAILRAVAAALLADDIERAGRLLRWLAVAPTPYDRWTANALGMVVTRAPRAIGALVHVVAAHRAWQQRARGVLGSHPPAPPAPPACLPRPAALAVVDRAIAWFERQRADFVTGARTIKEVRKLGELGVLADVLIRHGTTHARPQWLATGRELLVHAWEQLEQGNLLVEMIAAQPELAINVTVYWLFHRHGLRSAALEAAIVAGAPRIPKPIAYLGATAMQEVGLPAPWSVEETYAWTIVGQGIPPWRLQPIEVYLVTHVAFYNARFGGDRREFAGTDYLRRWLPVWLRHYQQVGAHDLLAEMIFTWHCVEGECCAPELWDTLVAAQQADGRIAFSRTAPGDDYHSTLMTITAALECWHR